MDKGNVLRTIDNQEEENEAELKIENLNRDIDISFNRCVLLW